MYSKEYDFFMKEKKGGLVQEEIYSFTQQG